MIYTALTRKVINFAFKAHEGQFDKSGYPYILHPVHLAEQMDTEDACVVAMLHDVCEDTEYTFEDLRKIGVTEKQIEALMLLTHDPAVPYLDYVRAIKNNELAAKVKMADLKHNSDISRLEVINEKTYQRVEKYKKAMEILNS